MSKSVECVVKHPKLHLMVAGKLTHVKPGTKINISEGQVERLGKKVAKASDEETVEVDAGTDATAKAAADAHAKAVKAATAKK
jgi:hypothetical protein